MWDVQVLGYQTFWKNKRSTLKSEHQTLVQQYPDADVQLKQLLKLLGDTENMAGHIPALVGESVKWPANENVVSYCKALHGKPLFSALYDTYTVTLDELKDLLKASTLADQTNSPKATGQQTTQEDGFREVWRRKWRAPDKTDSTSKKVAVKNKTSPVLNIPPKEVITQNFFAPLRAVGMDTDSSGTKAASNEEVVPGKTGRLPPIIITSTTNLIQL
jgi:hypothetical protein